uniref:Uncharacterized protein n=1 Tax=Anguilla anguilla TaxID=7936 RepID=A0A0E9S8G0_ANGAN
MLFVPISCWESFNYLRVKNAFFQILSRVYKFVLKSLGCGVVPR